jgi:hypothetical protein
LWDGRAALLDPSSNVRPTRAAGSPLDTVTLSVDVGERNKLRFLIDSGADLCLCKHGSLKEGTVYNSARSVNVKGISNAIEKTLGEVMLKLSTETHETDHKFQIVGDGINIPCDGLLGKDFFENKKAKIDYERREIAMGDVRIQFDDNSLVKEKGAETVVTLKPRCETIVGLPTVSGEMETGLVSKTELAPGIIVADTLTVVQQGSCLTSIVNTNDEEIKIALPTVKLDPYEVDAAHIRSINTQRAEGTEHRVRELRERVRTDHMTDVERRSIMRICEDYNDIFHLPGDRLSVTTAAEHAIPTPGIDQCRGIVSRNYRLPEALKGELKQITDQMLRDKIIRHSNSPWNSPIILVRKKEDASKKQKWRLVVDFRRLNAVTVGDSYPLPLISEILDALGKARYYTTADLASGFHQVPLRDEDRAKTAFSTQDGHFEFCTMPMGVTGAPSTFARMMSNIMSGLIGTKTLVYLDDIVVYGASLQEHNERLIEVFDRLGLHSLRLQPDKCEFLRKEVCYLGHKITPDGVKPDEKKVEAVMKFPVPTTTKQLKAFLGLAGYYRRFVPNFSPIAKPLHKLTGKNVPYVWGKEQDQAFQKLKHILCNEPLLQYPDFGKQFIVTCDASADGIGGVLSQGKIGKDLPIAYASRVLNKPERNYSTIERELTAIVWSCKQFRPYIWGRKFTIVTDHKPLTWVFKMNDPSSRIMRLKLKLQEFEYDIVYKKGKENSNSDGLSRMYTVAKGTIVREDVSENHKDVTAEYPGEVKSKDIDEDKRVTEKTLGDKIKSVAERKLRGIKSNEVSEENAEVSVKDVEVVAEGEK